MHSTFKVRCIFLNLILLYVFITYAQEDSQCKDYKEEDKMSEEEEEKSLGIFVVDWKFKEFSVHIALIIFVFCVIIFRMIYHRLHVVATYLPESLALIIIGIIFGVVVHFGLKDLYDKTVWTLTPNVFFTYLLPPIILDSAFGMYNRSFGDYLGTILLFAVLGTVLNFFVIAFLMYALHVANAMGLPNYNMDLKAYLLFASLIVAVDPVAVLAIFQDIGVDPALFYMVFGESLLNDAVTIVLYSIIGNFFVDTDIYWNKIVLGIVSFFTISLGGLLIGILIGVITCLVTRFQTKSDFVIVLLLGYFAYIIADLVGWSGLISMIGCGIVQVGYAFHNLSVYSVHIVREVCGEAAKISESIVFLYLGIAIITEPLRWHTGFILWSLVLCLFSRTIVTMFISALINFIRFDTHRISLKEQMVIIYGGLRGAVALALAFVIKSSAFDECGYEIREVMITTVLIIILFTVGLMGTTIKPVIKLLGVKMAPKKEIRLFSKLNATVLDMALVNMEALTGYKGRHTLRNFFRKLDDNYIRPFLQRDPMTSNMRLLMTHHKILQRYHLAILEPSKSAMHLAEIPEHIRESKCGYSPNLGRKYDSDMSFSPGYIYEIMDDGQILRIKTPDPLPDYEQSNHVVDIHQLDRILESNFNLTRPNTSLSCNSLDLGPLDQRTTLSKILTAKDLVIRHRTSMIFSSNQPPKVVSAPRKSFNTIQNKQHVNFGLINETSDDSDSYPIRSELTKTNSASNQTRF